MTRSLNGDLQAEPIFLLGFWTEQEGSTPIKIALICLSSYRYSSSGQY